MWNILLLGRTWEDKNQWTNIDFSIHLNVFVRAEMMDWQTLVTYVVVKLFLFILLLSALIVVPVFYDCNSLDWPQKCFWGQWKVRWPDHFIQIWPHQSCSGLSVQPAPTVHLSKIRWSCTNLEVWSLCSLYNTPNMKYYVILHYIALYYNIVPYYIIHIYIYIMSEYYHTNRLLIICVNKDACSVAAELCS